MKKGRNMTHKTGSEIVKGWPQENQEPANLVLDIRMNAGNAIKVINIP